MHKLPFFYLAGMWSLSLLSSFIACLNPFSSLLPPLNLPLPKTAQGCTWLAWFEGLTFFSKSKGQKLRSPFWNEIDKIKTLNVSWCKIGVTVHILKFVTNISLTGGGVQIIWNTLRKHIQASDGTGHIKYKVENILNAFVYVSI